MDVHSAMAMDAQFSSFGVCPGGCPPTLMEREPSVHVSIVSLSRSLALFCFEILNYANLLPLFAFVGGRLLTEGAW